MNRKFFTALLGVALFMGAPLIAAVMEYTGSDGVTPVKVKAATPLPITGIIGSITASLSGDVRITSSTATLPVSGTVTAIPTGTQTITGSVVASIPEAISATVTGTVVATIPEAVSIANFPADQTVSGNVGISGVASVTQAGASSFVQTSRSAEATAASFTTSASCESVSLFSLASTTIWFSLDGSGATVSAGIPLTSTGTVQAQQSFSCGPNVVVWYIASNSSAFTSLESGR